MSYTERKYSRGIESLSKKIPLSSSANGEKPKGLGRSIADCYGLVKKKWCNSGSNLM